MAQQNPSHNAAASSQGQNNSQSRLSGSQAQIARSTAATVVLEAAANLHELTTGAIAANVGWPQRLYPLHRLSLEPRWNALCQICESYK